MCETCEKFCQGLSAFSLRALLGSGGGWAVADPSSLSLTPAAVPGLSLLAGVCEMMGLVEKGGHHIALVAPQLGPEV